MDQLPERLPSNSSSNRDSSEPQTLHSTAGPLTSFEELLDSPTAHSSTEMEVVTPLINDTPAGTQTGTNSVIPALLLRRDSSGTQQATNTNTIDQQDNNLPEEHMRRGVTNVGLIEDDTINSIILVIQDETTLEVIPVGEVKKKKLKESLAAYYLSFDDADEPEELVEDDLGIPEGVTELNCSGESISVTVEQLYGTPILGQGAFGSVYAAVIQESSDMVIAVKRVPRNMTAEVAILQLVGTGDCLYIIDYYGAVANPGTSELCICMEYVDASLGAFYRTMHSLAYLTMDLLDQLLRRIAHNISSALLHLQIKGIVHRDIKPTNMLISRNAIIKLCDFGISRGFNDVQIYPDAIEGTQDYLPPGLTYTIQDDMWALGISLLEVATGRHPFVDLAQYGRSFLILMHKPAVPPTIHDDIQQFIRHLLKKEAQNRPGTYVEILNKPAVCNVTEASSSEFHDFVRHVIGKIPQPDDSS